ncbi:hypothetical protein MRS44_010511 [Fusarium solani]|uniref:uncharacterized protein n=1 Tax=Fusarium solani TaxID=169388 RepID=UPI0032C44447|nr:hypothetical protein MRS44_010511 [Fusarium solani]
MPNSSVAKKGKKRPKVKGCHECARRRIDCDRNEPECYKCRAKGVKCSGLGIRYRFNEGVASRGKLAYKLVPDTLSYKKDPNSTTKKDQEPCSSGDKVIETAPPPKPNSPDADNLAEDEDIATTDSKLWDLDWGLDHIDGRTRFFLQYFSDHIAQITAVINLGFNGYRDLVLPYAELDSMIRKAIVVVAEQHLALKTDSCAPYSPTYGSLLRDLVERSNQCPPVQDELAQTALLLLHIREMISGSDNFKLIYGSLRILIKNMVLEQNLESENLVLGRFVKIQILRVSLFGESLFDEANGSEFLLTHGEACLEFLRFCLRLHPEHEELMSYIFDLITMACDIYVQRATNNPPMHQTVQSVERFKQIANKVNTYDNIIGRHLLAWAYFVVAAESSTDSHREFFLERLQTLHCMTGCGNVLRAIEQIRGFWAVQGTTRWTRLLGGPDQALIM